MCGSIYIAGGFDKMDNFDKLAAGFVGVAFLLFVACLWRSRRDRKPIPRSIVLALLTQVFIAAYFTVLHHPTLRQNHPLLAPAVWLAWGGGSVWSGLALSRRAGGSVV